MLRDGRGAAHRLHGGTREVDGKEWQGALGDRDRGGRRAAERIRQVELKDKGRGKELQHARGNGQHQDAVRAARGGGRVCEIRIQCILQNGGQGGRREQ